jgi:hypothetical protein
MRHVVSYCPKILTSAIMALIPLLQVHAQTPKLTANDLLVNGESFFDASNIGKELSRLARADGVLASGEFHDVSVSGASISAVTNQFKNANPKPKYVVTDGGGIDLMMATCTAGDQNCSAIKSCRTTMINYINEMKKSGVKAFVWMCYPDPQKSYAGSLKTNQDIWAVVAKKVIDSITDPKPLWVDMRTAWQGHYDQYTSDGIHCTDAGGTASAEAFWKAMKANNFAFFDTGARTSTSCEPFGISTATPLTILSRAVSHNGIVLSLFLGQPTGINMRLTDISGRTVAIMNKTASVSGFQTIRFPYNAITPGIYCLEVKGGQFSENASLLVK